MWVAAARSVSFTLDRYGSTDQRRTGFRSRPVADASGAPVLRDQGPIGRPGTARSIAARRLNLLHREGDLSEGLIPAGLDRQHLGLVLGATLEELRRNRQAPGAGR